MAAISPRRSYDGRKAPPIRGHDNRRVSSRRVGERNLGAEELRPLWSLPRMHEEHDRRRDQEQSGEAPRQPRSMLTRRS